jgi:formate dehydrogenase maturation protein FdhE
MLRPWAEVLRGHGVRPDRPRPPGHCPFCGGLAVLACWRPASGAVGNTRLLLCDSCGLEWPAARSACPACGEEDPRKLPSFTSPEHPAARIEACASCRKYLKAIDLTVDARAVAEVDDLGTLALDSWALAHGYTRLEPWLGASSAAP